MPATSVETNTCKVLRTVFLKSHSFLLLYIYVVRWQMQPRVTTGFSSFRIHNKQASKQAEDVVPGVSSDVCC